MAWPLKAEMSQPQIAKILMTTKKAAGVWAVVALEDKIQGANRHIPEFNF